MENQHRKITGYRELNEDEIALMNEVKAHAQKTAELLERVRQFRENQYQGRPADQNAESWSQYDESLRCLALAKTQLQTGQMWFVRAIALPESF
jgi:hypothetical protein